MESMLATPADAEIILRLYELRTEATMRQARAWITGEFWPATADEFLAVANNPADPNNAYLRQVLSYWEMAAAMVLRAYAGTVVLPSVNISPWLFVSVMLLALLLGLGKRRHELALLAEHAGTHRPVLKQYGLPFLNQALTSVSSAAMVTYAIYAIASPTAARYPRLVVTVPLIIYAILRYLYLVLHRNTGGQPEELFLTDRPLYLTVLLWTATVLVIFLLGPAG